MPIDERLKREPKPFERPDAVGLDSEKCAERSLVEWRALREMTTDAM